MAARDAAVSSCQHRSFRAAHSTRRSEEERQDPELILGEVRPPPPRLPRLPRLPRPAPAAAAAVRTGSDPCALCCVVVRS